MAEKTYSQSDLDTRVSEAVGGARLAEAKFIAARIEAKGLDFAEWLQEHIA
jgi:hypothetical protein